jgi:hypothetical protein
MNEPHLASLWAALPGVIVVAVLSFPLFFFPSWHFGWRLLGACIAVVAGLSLFGQFIGHQFDFLRKQDLPILIVGFGGAFVLSAVGRLLRGKRP